MKLNRKISLDDRIELERLLHSGINKVEIARILKIHETTIYRELKRCQGAYNAKEAQETYGKSFNLLDFEIIGKRFGLLTVKAFANIYKKRSWWNCMCDCGKACVISRKMMMDYCSKKRPLSCGCVPKQWHSKKNQLPIEELALRKFHDLLKYRKIEGDCWIWTGCLTRGKTPRCSWRSKSLTVRKCMYLLFNGTTYEPNRIYTTCGNLMCFNPDHLTIQCPEKRHYYNEEKYD